jgi:hypothetical protein
MPQHSLDDALEQLVRADLIFRRGMLPDAEYTFKHALVQDAAYSTLLRSRRQQLHGRITAILEARFPQIVQTQPEVLARHSADAGFGEKAVGYCLKAGRQAMARWEMREAVAHLQKGLDAISDLPREAERQKQELELQFALGNALLATSGYAAVEVGEAFDRARQLCEPTNQPPDLGPVLVCQFTYRLVRGEFDRAEYHAGEMRRLGEVNDDPMWKFYGSYASGNIGSWCGNFHAARDFCENALSLWNPSNRAAELTTDDTYVVCLALICADRCSSRLPRSGSPAEGASADRGAGVVAPHSCRCPLPDLDSPVVD